jgi:hypothetical protein
MGIHAMRWLSSVIVLVAVTTCAVAQPMLDPQPPGAPSPSEEARNGYWISIRYAHGWVEEVSIRPNPSDARVLLNESLVAPFTPRGIDWRYPQRSDEGTTGLVNFRWWDYDVIHPSRGNVRVRLQYQVYARPSNLGQQLGDMFEMRWWVTCVNGRDPALGTQC